MKGLKKTIDITERTKKPTKENVDKTQRTH